VARSTISLISVSNMLVLIGALALGAILVLFFTACQGPPAQKGGRATTSIHRPGSTNAATLTQSDNPKEPSKQTVQSEQTFERRSLNLTASP
jgi:hypothetical protein